jgi:hypothetical protein
MRVFLGGLIMRENRLMQEKEAKEQIKAIKKSVYIYYK